MSWTMRRTSVELPVLLGLALAAVSCAAEPEDVGVWESGGGPGSGTESTSAGSSAGVTSGSSDSASGGDSATTGDASGGTGIKFDIGGDPDIPGNCGGDAECEGCTAVDILFIVDNSGSMDTHKAAVAAAFDPFVNQMVDVLPPSTSLHVGVTRATGFYDPGNGSAISNCEGSYIDGSYYPPTVGTTTTNGQQGRLYEHAGQRFFEYETGQDAAALKTWFEGTLSGAIAGDDHSNTETVVAGAAYPFHPVNAAHNDGFMREQAVLVLFLLSDAADLTPADVPTQDYIDMVSDAKASCGDMCIITTGAISQGCYDQPGITNTRLYDFMNGFGSPPASYVELGFSGTPDFASVLGTALSDVIATTCENIPPQG